MSGDVRRVALIALCLLAREGRAHAASIMSGRSATVSRVAAGAGVSYSNNGFRQLADGDRVTVEVELDDETWSRAPFSISARAAAAAESGDAVARLGCRAARGAATRAEAVARVLHAIAARVRYVRDPGVELPAETLKAGMGDCVSRSNLAVATLTLLDIPARVVRGAVVRDDQIEPHRWIEVFYPDAGWVFSDPTESINYVSARHIVMTPPPEPDPGYQPARVIQANIELLFVDGGFVTLDVHPGRSSELAERRAVAAQFSATVFGRVRPPTPGTVTLLGHGLRRVQTVAPGQPFSFPGLTAGAYVVQGQFGDLRTRRSVQVDGAHLVSVEVTIP